MKWDYIRRDRDYFFTAAATPPTPARFSGTLTIDWQCWHFTVFPRTSSGTLSTFRQRRFGHKIITGIGRPFDNQYIGHWGRELELIGAAPVIARRKSAGKSSTFSAGCTL
jgi:hypothetical protein